MHPIATAAPHPEPAQTQTTSENAFLSVYGSNPLVVLTEKLPERNLYLASLPSPSQRSWYGSGCTWQAAHQDLFTNLMQEFGTLSRNQNRLTPDRMLDLDHLQFLAHDGTLAELARFVSDSIATAKTKQNEPT